MKKRIFSNNFIAHDFTPVDTIVKVPLKQKLLQNIIKCFL